MSWLVQAQLVGVRQLLAAAITSLMLLPIKPAAFPRPSSTMVANLRVVLMLGECDTLDRAAAGIKEEVRG